MQNKSRDFGCQRIIAKQMFKSVMIVYETIKGPEKIDLT